MEKNNLPAVHSINELMSTAKLFAESGMFADSRSMAQAFVKIQAGAELGIPPFASMSGVHIIKGKPAIGAGLMASRVKASGKYDYQVIEQSDVICRIEYYQGKKSIGISEFTLEQARKAGTQNLDKFPKNMLFARAMSNGVKFFCPDVFSGPVYVPEEMNVVEETAYTEVKDVAATVVEDAITDEMQQIIDEAKTVAGVKSIWDAHEVLHNSRAFKKAIKVGKERAFAAQAMNLNQKTQILLLLNRPVITKEEKEKMIANINTLSSEQAESSITKLKAEIKKRQSDPKPEPAPSPTETEPVQ